MRICKLLTKKFIFCALICVSRLKTTAKMKKTFWKFMLLLYSHYFKKSFQFENFYRSVFRRKILKPLFVWSSIHSIGIFFFAGRKCVDLVVIFNKGREKNFCGIFTKLKKLCLHKIFNIGLTTKVNSREFCVFILDVKCTELQYC